MIPACLVVTFLAETLICNRCTWLRGKSLCTLCTAAGPGWALRRGACWSIWSKQTMLPTWRWLRRPTKPWRHSKFPTEKPFSCSGTWPTWHSGQELDRIRPACASQEVSVESEVWMCAVSGQFFRNVFQQPSQTTWWGPILTGLFMAPHEWNLTSLLQQHGALSNWLYFACSMSM